MPQTLNALFTGTNGTQLHTYTPDSGALTVHEPNSNATVRGWYTIQSNQAQFLIDNGWPYALIHDTGGVEHETQITFVTLPSTGPALAVLYNDFANFIGIRRYGSNYFLSRWATTETRTDTGQAYTAGDVIRTERVGNDLKFYKNGSGTAFYTYTLTAGEQTAYAACNKVALVSRDTGGTSTLDTWTAANNVSNTLTITDPKTVYAVSPGSTSKTISFSGTYTGTVGSTLQYKLEAETTPGSGTYTTVTDWTDAPGTPSGGTWSFSLSVARRTTLYRITVRDKATALVVSSASPLFGVGYVIALVGQSWVADLWQTIISFATYSITNDNRSYSVRAGAYGTGQSMLRAIAAHFVALTGYPCAVAGRGISNTALALLNPGTTNWGNLITTDIAAGPADLTGAHIEHGHADIAGTAAAYKLELDDIMDNTAATPPGLKSYTGRTGAQIATTISLVATDTSLSSSSDTGYSKIRQAQAEWAAARALAGDNVSVSHSNIDLPHFDALHPTEAGFVEMCFRIARAQAIAHGLISDWDARGPWLATGTASRNGTTCTITPALNGNTALTGTGPFDGWQESTNGTTWSTVTDLTRSGNTLTCADRGQTHFRYLYGDNPPITTIVRGDRKAATGSANNLPVGPTITPLLVSVSAPAAAWSAGLSFARSPATGAAAAPGAAWTTAAAYAPSPATGAAQALAAAFSASLSYAASPANAGIVAPARAWALTLGLSVSPATATVDTLMPLTLAEAKAQVRETGTDNDTLLTSIVEAVGKAIEARIGHVVTGRETRTFRFAGFEDEMAFRRCPVASIASVEYREPVAGAWTTLATSVYELDTNELGDPVLTLKFGQSWPSVAAMNDPVRVTALVGYASNADIPEPIRQAARVLAGHLFDNRSGEDGELLTKAPALVDWLLADYRLRWL